MSQEQPITENQVASRQPISIPFGQISRAPALSVIGLPELLGLAGAALLAVLVVFAYLYFYLPAHSRLTSIELERARLQGTLKASGVQLQENTSTREPYGSRSKETVMLCFVEASD